MPGRLLSCTRKLGLLLNIKPFILPSTFDHFYRIPDSISRYFGSGWKKMRCCLVERGRLECYSRIVALKMADKTVTNKQMSALHGLYLHENKCISY